MAGGLAAARMAHQGDPFEVDLAVERIAGGRVPVAPQLEVLEQHPAAAVVFLVEAAGRRAVEEIFVDRNQDDAAAGQEAAQPFVAGIEKSDIMWLPCTIRASGKGPGPSGYQTRPLRGKASKPKPQYQSRTATVQPSLPLTKGVASTVVVLIAGRLRRIRAASGRCRCRRSG